MRQLAAVPVAVLAAVTFAGSAVLQQRSARDAPDEESLRPRLLLDLLRRPSWDAGVAAMILAYLLQALALGLGAVSVVEPIVAGELVFAVPAAARLQGMRPGWREWAGMLAAAGGVSMFLLAAHPTGGTNEPSLLAWASGALPWALVLAAALLLARGPATPRRAALLALGAGVSFGLLALVTKSAVGLLTSGGIGSLITSWQPEALLVLGAGGFLIGQSSYQAAPLASSLPVMDAAEPISAVLLSAYVLHERLALAPPELALELCGAAVAVAGIFLLGRSPLVITVYRSTERVEHDEHAAPRPASAAGRGR